MSGRCAICGKPFVSDGFGTGYGITLNGEKHCYECCGKEDKEQLLNLKPKEKMCLYLSKGKITNWPGTLKIEPTKIREGRHNLAGVRQDVWFTLEGNKYHGVQYGYDTEICHVQKVKA